MAWIFWGTTTQQTALGSVADSCPVCEKVQRFEVTDHYKASHIQFIRTEDWQIVGSTKKCSACGAELICNKNSYSAILPDASAETPIDELLEKTNRRLAVKLRKEAHQELGLGESRGRADGKDDKSVDDPVLERNLDRIAECETNDPELFKLKEKLKVWGKLDAKRRNDLTLVLNEFCDRQQRLMQAKEFLFLVSLSYPTTADNVGCGIVFFLTAATVVGLYFLPTDFSWLPMICGGFSAFLILMMGYLMFLSERSEAWLRKQVLPRAISDRIPLDALFEVASQVDSWSDDEKKRAIGVNVKRLAELVDAELKAKAAAI